MRRNALIASWGAVILTSFYLRVEFSSVAAWAFDQAGLLWQAVRWVQDGVYPTTGIISSTGALSFNTSTLITAIACMLPGGVKVTSIALATLQIPVLVLFIRAVPGLCPWRRLLVTAAVLFNPWLIGIGVDNWPQFLSLNWICLLLILAWRVLDSKAGGITWFGLGLALPFTVTAYLGNAAFVTVLTALIGWTILHRQIDFGWRRFAQFVAGLTVGFTLFVAPYLVHLWGTEALEPLFNQSYGSNPRNLDNFLKTLSHPWRLLFDPRNFFWYTQKAVAADSVSGLSSIHTLRYLHMIAVGFCCLALFRRHQETPDPYSYPHLKFVAGTWAAVILLYFILPSTVFVTDHKGAAWYGAALTTLYAGIVAGAARLRMPKIDLVLLALISIVSFSLTLEIVRDNREYKGSHIPFVDAPLDHRLSAVAWIAESGQDIGVAYHFSYGNRQNLEREYAHYAATYSDGALTTGRLFDAELLLHYNIHNQNNRLIDRHLGDNHFLVTYAAIPRDQLPAPWTGGTEIFKDFGRLRIWKR